MRLLDSVAQLLRGGRWGVGEQGTQLVGDCVDSVVKATRVGMCRGYTLAAFVPVGGFDGYACGDVDLCVGGGDAQAYGQRAVAVAVGYDADGLTHRARRLNR